jgi:DNA-binding HxlR family transcriptional regulator
MSSRILPVEAMEPAPFPRAAGILCPVGRAMDVIGDRWTLVLIRHLLEGPRKFQELRMRTGIAPRVLSGRLRQLAADGFVDKVGTRGSSAYQVTARGRTFEPVINAVARWFLLHGIEHIDDPDRFNATSAASILESLPFLLRAERARSADLTFEVRLSGPGGGVWTVRIRDGRCTVREGFAEKADVRYTADARVWCAVALGLADAKDVYRRGLMTKDGGREAMDYYFDQIVRTRRAGRSKAKKRST